MANRLKALGYDELQIEIEKYRIMDAANVDDIKKAEQKERILLKQVELVNEYANIISSKLTTAFTDIMSGQKGFGSIGTAINEGLVEGYRKSVSESLTNLVMSTGLGDIFGGAMASIKGVFGGLSGKIEGAFDVGGKTTYNWIVRGFNDARGGTSSFGGTSKTGVASFAGGAGGAVAGFLGSGWFSQPITNQGTAQAIGQNGQPFMMNGQMVYPGEYQQCRTGNGYCVGLCRLYPGGRRL